MDFNRLQELVDDSQDKLFSVTGAPSNRFVLVNGQLAPTIQMNTAEWVRFRIIWAAWLLETLDFSVPGCEMQLLAKDGIYIRDFPRRISSAPIVEGGRADIMVKCTNPSTSININGAGQVIATIETTAGPTIASESLQSWSPNFPTYLADLRTMDPTPGCSCQTEFGGNAVNDRRFEESKTFHESHIGAVVDRELIFGNHPYHQHVYAFQLISVFNDKSGYDKIGDWHDVVRGNGLICYQPTGFTGKIMVHCHRLLHEDSGMMAIEMVHPSDTSI